MDIYFHLHNYQMLNDLLRNLLTYLALQPQVPHLCVCICGCCSYFSFLLPVLCKHMCL